MGHAFERERQVEPTTQPLNSLATLEDFEDKEALKATLGVVNRRQEERPGREVFGCRRLLHFEAHFGEFLYKRWDVHKLASLLDRMLSAQASIPLYRPPKAFFICASTSRSHC